MPVVGSMWRLRTCHFFAPAAAKEFALTKLPGLDQAKLRSGNFKSPSVQAITNLDLVRFEEDLIGPKAIVLKPSRRPKFQRQLSYA